MTAASGQPYLGGGGGAVPVHAQPRFPNYPLPKSPHLSNSYAAQQQPLNGYTNNGFTSATLSVPAPATSASSPIVGFGGMAVAGEQVVMPQQAMPMQPIRPIQPVQVREQNYKILFCVYENGPEKTQPFTSQA